MRNLIGLFFVIRSLQPGTAIAFPDSPTPEKSIGEACPYTIQTWLQPNCLGGTGAAKNYSNPIYGENQPHGLRSYTLSSDLSVDDHLDFSKTGSSAQPSEWKSNSACGAFYTSAEAMKTPRLFATSGQNCITLQNDVDCWRLWHD